MVEIKNSEKEPEIKPLDNMGNEVKGSSNAEVNSAKEYWNEVFSMEPEQDEFEIDENVFAEIFGVSEEQFQFDFDVYDEKLQDALQLFREDEWNELDYAERIGTSKALIDTLASMLGIEEIPDLELFDGIEDLRGQFVSRENKVEINTIGFETPGRLVETIAHEMRHAYQEMRAMLGETKQDILYALNFENYISPVEIGDRKFLFFSDYQDQLVEAEARAFAKLFREA